MANKATLGADEGVPDKGAKVGKTVILTVAGDGADESVSKREGAEDETPGLGTKLSALG
jgi:hypothetical protein